MLLTPVMRHLILTMNESENKICRDISRKARKSYDYTRTLLLKLESKGIVKLTKNKSNYKQVWNLTKIGKQVRKEVLKIRDAEKRISELI